MELKMHVNVKLHWEEVMGAVYYRDKGLFETQVVIVGKG